jgi:hypothetical protein
MTTDIVYILLLQHLFILDLFDYCVIRFEGLEDIELIECYLLAADCIRQVHRVSHARECYFVVRLRHRNVFLLYRTKFEVTVAFAFTRLYRKSPRTCWSFLCMPT